jgi:hypothetical protein
MEILYRIKIKANIWMDSENINKNNFDKGVEFKL